MSPFFGRLVVAAAIFFVFSSLNHDFIDGSYAGPDWFYPIDLLLTNAMALFISHRMLLGQSIIDNEKE